MGIECGFNNICPQYGYYTNMANNNSSYTYPSFYGNSLFPSIGSFFPCNNMFFGNIFSNMYNNPYFVNPFMGNIFANPYSNVYSNFTPFNFGLNSSSNNSMSNFGFGNSQFNQKPSKKTDNSSDLTTVNNKGMFLKGKGKNSQYGPKFLARVKEIAKNIKCDYRDLLAVMNSESGIDAKTVGSNGASGLICFMPRYYDVAKIRKMTPMQQLDLVEDTFLKSKKQYGFGDSPLSKGDLYALIFLPGRAKNDVLAVKGETGKNGKLLKYYEDNEGLDANGDKKITKEEMAARINDKYVSDRTFLA